MAAQRYEWEDSNANANISRQGGALPPLYHFLHFNLALCVTEIRHESRTPGSGMISSTSLPLSCFLSSPAAKALGSAAFLTIYLAESLFLVMCTHEMVFLPAHSVARGARGMKPQLPQFVFTSGRAAVGLKHWSFRVMVFVIFQHHLQLTLWPRGL